MILTAADLRRFAPHGTAIIVDAVAMPSATALPKWGITTAARLHMFLAMVSVESAGLTKVFEDMSYSAERIHAVWPNRFDSVAAAQPYAHRPEKLANKVYGGRMGNTGPDDGWLCRGTGLLQTTGLTAFSRLAKAMHVSVDQLRANLTDPLHMLDCAAATFATWGLLPYADKGDTWGATRTLNGGLIGLADREHAYALAQRIWPAGKAAA